MFRFPKKARGHSMCSTMVGGSWRLAVGGSWRLAVGNWRLVAVGGGWRRLVAGGWWRLVVGGWWRLAVDGSWRLAVGGPLGLSLRAVLSKKKKISSLKDAPGGAVDTGPIPTKNQFPCRTLAACLSVAHQTQHNEAHYRWPWAVARRWPPAPPPLGPRLRVRPTVSDRCGASRDHRSVQRPSQGLRTCCGPPTEAHPVPSPPPPPPDNSHREGRQHPPHGPTPNRRCLDRRMRSPAGQRGPASMSSAAAPAHPPRLATPLPPGRQGARGGAQGGERPVGRWRERVRGKGSRWRWAHWRRPLHTKTHQSVVPNPRPQGCIGREGTSETAPAAVRQAVGGGYQSGWGTVTVGYKCR